ncbi:MAG: HAMP domain-containing histidine kinase [Lachnospiraceae bacterium]|nr:HAMP domain-containing histidine kinase [Lachnospiraceae bacterium]
MTVRQKITIAIIISFAIPLFFTVFTASFCKSSLKQILKKNYNYVPKKISLFKDSYLVADEISNNNFNMVYQEIIKSPESFVEIDNLDTINKDLQKVNAFLFVQLNSNDLFYGRSTNDFAGIFNIIHQGYPHYLSEDAIYNSYFVSDNGKNINTFVITNLGPYTHSLEKYVNTVIAVFVISLLTSAVLLGLWLYFSFYRQFELLTSIARQISESELDLPIKVPDSDDEIIRLCKKLELTRQKLLDMLEERLQYEEDTRVMITSLAHDFRTPLTAIKGYSEGLRDNIAKTEEKRNQYLQTIYNKACDLTYLVDELSLFSKVEGNNIIYNFKALNLNNYFIDCMEEIDLDISSSNFDVTFTNNVNKDTRILADPEQLKRVITNICGNSIKYNDKEKGILNITINELVKSPKLYKVLDEMEKKEDTLVIVSIADNGPGVSDKALPLIFNRFYRTDSSRNSSKPGSGLGLSIVAKIVYDHGGKIWAERNEYGGLTIFFTLKTKNSI